MSSKNFNSSEELEMYINNEAVLSEIDYVLVNKLNETDYNKEREIFERNLVNTGLQVKLLDITEHERFLQIKAPKETLLQYCEIMKLRMPLKNFDKKEYNLSEQYSRNRQYLFDIQSENFITPSIKYMIISFILEHTKFKEDDNENDESDEDEDRDIHNFGITKLIMKNAYTAAYPLHDNEKRNELKKVWNVNYPPLEKFKNYFGIKIALYFAWLRFYNVMLWIASVISLLYFLVGFLLSYSNKIQDEICKGNETFYMCPQCDKNCAIWNLKDICSYTGIVFILNNSITVFYTIIMAIWSAIYMNMWSQYSATIIQKWGVVDGDDLLVNETPTKEYLGSKIKNINRCKKFPNIFLSLSVVLFWVCIVLAVLVGMTFYRISLYTSEWIFGHNSQIVKSTIVEVTGAILDLISILILNSVYSKVAYKITKQELHRTQKQFEESLMWKFYIFWFINYYSSFFYIAFIKGRFAGTPHSYNRIFGYRQEECGSRGCIVDLFIQIAVVMIGDMTYNNLIEYVVPYVRKKIRGSKVVKETDCDKLVCKPWIRDYKLLYWGSTEISMEYLEMVLQYGLVILFVTAFPLGPICALINNIIEIRMDSKNLITNFRRPIAQNVKNIGVWLPILEMIVNLSVISNACIIAFTTYFIPDLVYKYYERKKQSYIDFSLSRMSTSDLDPIAVSNYSAFGNITECRYVGYYNPPEHPNKYSTSELYWHILAARLLFVLLFQYLVSFLKIIIQSIIPTIPHKLKASIINQLKRTQRLIILEENKQTHIRRRTFS